MPIKNSKGHTIGVIQVPHSKLYGPQLRNTNIFPFGFAVSQQIQQLALHPEWRELCRSFLHLLRHGHLQHQHVLIIRAFPTFLPCITFYHGATVVLNFLRFEKAIAAENKQRVILEVLSYHATAPVEEASKLKVKHKQKLVRWMVGHWVRRWKQSAVLCWFSVNTKKHSSAVSSEQWFVWQRSYSWFLTSQRRLDRKIQLENWRRTGTGYCSVYFS